MRIITILAALLIGAALSSGPAYASCADELKQVKQRLAETPTSGANEERVESAKVKILEAEEALKANDEQACMTAVEAADATLPD